MKRTEILAILFVALALIVCVANVSKAAPLGTAFTYQGRLLDANDTADGEYDLQFKLYDAPNGGVQQESTIEVNDLDVIDGYFTVELDFGSGVFDGDARWLEIGVRPGDSNDPFAILSPRQEVTPTPYSLYAKNAGTDNDWIVSGSSMYSIPGRVGIGTTNPETTTLFVQRPSAVSPFVVWQDGLVIKDGQRCIGNQLEVQDSSGNIQFVVTGTRVGIGTDSPGTGLHVKGAGWPDAFMSLQSNSNEDAGMRLYEGETVKWHFLNESGADGLGLRNTAYSSVLFAKQNTGNIGIGTTNPGAKLEVNGGNSEAGLRAAWGSDYPNLYGDFKHAGSGGLKINANANGGWADMSLQTDGTTRLFIESGGNVGIGTTSPSAGLHLKGAGYPSSFMYLQSNLGQDAGIRLYEGNTIKWHIYNSSSDDGLVILNSTDYTPVLFAEQSTGKVKVQVLEITGGSDLSEQFEVSDEVGQVKPGMVVCIDPENPGNLVVSKTTYDRTVAGIVSGAGGVKPGMLMGQKGTKADGEHPVAMTGRVYCRADASNGVIRPGDLLTTSQTPGHAMKVTDYDRAQGAIIGKAMDSLDEGTGLVLVLVSLQ